MSAPNKVSQSFDFTHCVEFRGVCRNRPNAKPKKLSKKAAAMAADSAEPGEIPKCQQLQNRRRCAIDGLVSDLVGLTSSAPKPPSVTFPQAIAHTKKIIEMATAWDSNRLLREPPDDVLSKGPGPLGQAILGAYCVNWGQGCDQRVMKKNPVPCSRGGIWFFHCLIAGLKRAIKLIDVTEPPPIKPFIKDVRDVAGKWLKKYGGFRDNSAEPPRGLAATSTGSPPKPKPKPKPKAAAAALAPTRSLAPAVQPLAKRRRLSTTAAAKPKPKAKAKIPLRQSTGADADSITSESDSGSGSSNASVCGPPWREVDEEEEENGAAEEEEEGVWPTDEEYIVNDSELDDDDDDDYRVSDSELDDDNADAATLAKRAIKKFRYEVDVFIEERINTEAESIDWMRRLWVQTHHWNRNHRLVGRPSKIGVKQGKLTHSMAAAFNPDLCMNSLGSCVQWGPESQSILSPCDKGAMGFYNCFYTGLYTSMNMIMKLDPPPIRDFIAHTQTAAKNWLHRFDKSFPSFAARTRKELEKHYKAV
jgi:hypothetical protein